MRPEPERHAHDAASILSQVRAHGSVRVLHSQVPDDVAGWAIAVETAATDAGLRVAFLRSHDAVTVIDIED